MPVTAVGDVDLLARRDPPPAVVANAASGGTGSVDGLAEARRLGEASQVTGDDEDGGDWGSLFSDDEDDITAAWNAVEPAVESTQLMPAADVDPGTGEQTSDLVLSSFETDMYPGVDLDPALRLTLGDAHDHDMVFNLFDLGESVQQEANRNDVPDPAFYPTTAYDHDLIEKLLWLPETLPDVPPAGETRDPDDMWWLLGDLGLLPGPPMVAPPLDPVVVSDADLPATSPTVDLGQRDMDSASSATNLAILRGQWRDGHLPYAHLGQGNSDRQPPSGQ